MKKQYPLSMNKKPFIFKGIMSLKENLACI